MNVDNETINLKEVVSSRFGNLIPMWFIGLMEKYFHMDFLNSILAQHYPEEEFCLKALDYADIKLDVHGEIPDEGHYTFACNHPLGAIDGLAMTGLIGRRFNDKVRLLANDFLMHVKKLAPKIVPVNRMGGQKKDILKRLDDAFGSDNQILVFPAGNVSRIYDGVIQDNRWQKSFVSRSIASERDVVPVHIEGRNSKKFYRLASLERFVKSKFPLTTLALPGELYRAQGKTFTITIGNPIPWQTFDKRRSMDEWAAWVRSKVYQLH